MQQIIENNIPLKCSEESVQFVKDLVGNLASKQQVRTFLSRFSSMYAGNARSAERLKRNEASWLDRAFVRTDESVDRALVVTDESVQKSRGRPELTYNESTERTKRRKISELIEREVPKKLVHAVARKLADKNFTMSKKTFFWNS